MLRQKHSLDQLRQMMRALYEARYSGADAVRISRMQGQADGYMQALCELGVVKERELVMLIEEERRQVTASADARFTARLAGVEVAPHMA